MSTHETPAPAAPVPTAARPYAVVPSKVDLAAVDRQIMALWADKDVFHRSLAQREGAPEWTFYEGPPTANGTPGTHHVEARVFKDVFPRFKTMRGYRVDRKAGWDCHGLPVELAVEKELGFTGKGDIEAYGVAEFNARCRESVLRHVDEFAVLTERMGYWVDMDQAYWTMDPAYVQSVWWSLKAIFDKGLLVQDHRVSPYCPRCGTGLSDHELAQDYEDVVDPSVYVRMPVTSGPLAERFPGVSLLVWTTTPWTLVSNTAVAVKPDASYQVVRVTGEMGDSELLVIAEALREAKLPEGHEVLATMPGRDLERTGYARPFDLVDIPDAHYVILADYVTTEDGSGLVHQSPAFGAEDLISCRAYGLPVVNPLLPDGTFDPSVPLVGGLFFKAADATLVADLEARGLMFRHELLEHSYPHCWRCHTPLVYYAQPSWYIRTTAIKDDLLRENEGTTWHPETIKWGRYGDWLENNVDWALSRNRYWGTPLPIWRCPEDHLTCIGSLAELGDLAGQDLSELDPHRPYVDDVTFDCPQCAATATRVPEVIDGWYDSGAMPFAQWGYPHAGADEFARKYPADFICEAIDQTRGWFYTLMAVGTLVFDQSSYRTVLVLGHILDDDGRKMSKHLGNILEPIPLMDDHGADALRWFMLAAGSPWQARRVGHAAIAEVVRRTLLTYWNTVSFQSLYARTAGFTADPATAPDPADRPVLDRWALAEASRLAAEVTDALDNFDTQRAGRLLAAFIDDLSNWYVRRSRRRFWEGDPSALHTLHECLRTLTLLMAPFTPFITERVWQDLFATDDGDSVHLQDWPDDSAALADPALSDQVALIRRLVELGRGARAEGKVRTRQPLGRALVSAPGWDRMPAELRDQLTDELNVVSVVSLGGGTEDATTDELVHVSVKANFRSLGRRFGKGTQPVAAAIAGADPVALTAALRGTGSAMVDVAGQPESIGLDDVVITETPREGWAVATDAGETLALDLHLTPELIRRGLAREVVRLVQEGRKSAGLDVSDRIELWLATDSDELGAAIEEHSSDIAGEVLAVAVSRDPAPADAFGGNDPDLGIAFALRLGPDGATATRAGAVDDGPVMSERRGRVWAMVNQDPRVDRSRGAVYQAEDSVASVMRRPHRMVRVGSSVVTLPEEVRFGSLEAIQAFVDAVLADATGSGQFPDRGPVLVDVRRGFRMATYSQGRIHIPAADPRGRWALTRSVVLHEVAHHLNGVPGHGRGFREALVTLYARHISAGAAELLTHLFAPIDAVPEMVDAELGPDEQVRRVAALLAKAESTPSAEEAEAYLAKAALVAQRHSVDMAVAAMGAGAHTDGPTHRMLTIGEPRRALNKLLVSLMVATARAWSVRVDIGHGSTYVLVYGIPADLDRVEAVFATASTLMLTRAQEHVRSGLWRGTTYRPSEGGPARPVTAPVARNAFCLGFIHRLGANLDAAARQARAGASTSLDEHTGSGPAPRRVELALRARDLAVTDYHRATSRARGTWRGSSSGAATASDSRRAGERAADEFGRRGVAGGRRAIGR